MIAVKVAAAYIALHVIGMVKQFVKHVEVKVESQVKMKCPMRFISLQLGTNRFKIFVNYVLRH